MLVTWLFTVLLLACDCPLCAGHDLRRCEPKSRPRSVNSTRPRTPPRPLRSPGERRGTTPPWREERGRQRSETPQGHGSVSVWLWRLRISEVVSMQRRNSVLPFLADFLTFLAGLQKFSILFLPPTSSP